VNQSKVLVERSGKNRKAFTLIKLFTMRKRKAFTLIELLVVVAIIGILATVVVVNVSSAQNKARDAKVKANMNTVQKAAALYYTENGTYPNLNCNASTAATCSAQTSTDTNIQAIINAAKDIATINSVSLAFASNGTTYQAFTALPSNQSQSVIVSEVGSVNTSNVPLSGLIGWWSMREASGNSVQDVSGSGNNGTLNGSIVDGTTWATGKNSNPALYFNGTNNYLSTVNSSFSYDAGSYSVSMWFKSPNSPNSSDGKMIATNNNRSELQYFNGQLRVCNGVVPCVAGGPLINDNAWHFAAVTGSGGVTRVYLDGGMNPIFSLNNGGAINGGGTVRIGSGFPSGYLFNGTLDDVRFYNRALSSAEILALYNNTP